ncbi:uncharacterized protein LOC134235508 [Saccostrea cucullata]|uniref:uncharacterized protein LOC134235508 n=1 Tax=Saccostrea cuccullata TaxID=36930 RepID=UPI002ED06601
MATKDKDTETDTKHELDSESHSIDEESRIRALTGKATQVYEDKVKHYTVELSILWDRVDYMIQCVEKNKGNLNSLLEMEKKLFQDIENFDQFSQEFREYLTRTRSHESVCERQRLDFLKKGYDLLIQNAKRNLKKYLEEQHKKEEKSEYSYRSRTTSTRSSQSSIIARKSAKAEAAKVSLQFAKEAAELKKKQALIEQQYALETATAKAHAERQKVETQAKLELLKKEQEAAEAEAEVSVLRSFDGDEDASHRSLPSLPESDSHTKTKDYVANLTIVPPQDFVKRTSDQQTSNMDDMVGNHKTFGDLYRRDIHRELHSVPPASAHPVGVPQDFLASSSLNPEAPSYKPTNPSLSSDFTKFLLKKDLLLTRLTTFNDKPETYASWKNSFKNIMEELGVTPVEEIDLLVKWLGKDSQKYAQSLKTSTSNDPIRGLHRIWDRLDERFGAPEMVEAALKHKVDSFAKITSKNLKSLYELTDILSEIESVKEDTKFSTLLGYYDSSSGVTPYRQKTPHKSPRKMDYSGCQVQ